MARFDAGLLSPTCSVDGLSFKRRDTVINAAALSFCHLFALIIGILQVSHIEIFEIFQQMAWQPIKVSWCHFVPKKEWQLIMICCHNIFSFFYHFILHCPFLNIVVFVVSSLDYFFVVVVHALSSIFFQVVFQSSHRGTLYLSLVFLFSSLYSYRLVDESQVSVIIPLSFALIFCLQIQSRNFFTSLPRLSRHVLLTKRPVCSYNLI